MSYRTFESIWMYLKSTLNPTYHSVYDRFNAKHPEVWDMFREKALKAVELDHKKAYSARRIVQEIRWDEKTPYHMPDPVIAYYARRFIAEFPQYRHLFVLKGLSMNIDQLVMSRT